MPGILSLEGFAATLSFLKVASDEIKKYKQNKAASEVAMTGYHGRKTAGAGTRRTRNAPHAPPSLAETFGSSVPSSQFREKSRVRASYSNTKNLDAIANMMQEPVRARFATVSDDGDKGADQRVKHIIDMIRRYVRDPRTRKLAGDILIRAKVPEKDWSREVQAIFVFLRDQIRYTRDPVGLDTYTSPLRTLSHYHIGDCDDYTIAGASLLATIGYPVRVRIIQLRGRPTWGHIYLMVGMPPTDPTHWLPFDASVDKPLGFQAPPAAVQRYKDFEV